MYLRHGSNVFRYDAEVTASRLPGEPEEMTMDLAWFVKSFVTLLVVVDPIGSIPVFIYATTNIPAQLHRAFAVRAVLIAGGVLMFFLALGQLLLEGIGLRLGSGGRVWWRRLWQHHLRDGTLITAYSYSDVPTDPKLHSRDQRIAVLRWRLGVGL